MTLHERFISMMVNHPNPYIDTRDHLPFLRSMAKGVVVEIGTDVGNSTCALLLGVEEHGGHVTSIDINPKCAGNFNHPQWTFINKSSQDIDINAVPTWADHIDLLYVDGDHSYKAAKHDIEYFGKLVTRGGLILVHDVEHPQFPGVRQAFDECQLGAKTIQHGSWGLGIIRVA